MEDPVEKIAIDLAKQLPLQEIYDDGLKQPVKEVGNIFSDTLKTLRLTAGPIQYAAAL